MIPTEYFDSIVIPAFREYREAEERLNDAIRTGIDTTAAESEARRRAFASAVATWHMADWMYYSTPDPARTLLAPTLAKYREGVEAQHCYFLRSARQVRDFNLIGAIADASKHFELRSDAREIKTANAIAELSTGFGQLAWGEGKYGGGKQVIITLQAGPPRAYSSVLQNCIDMWRLTLGVTLPPIGQ
jgi:hypothetical protein